MKRSKERSTKDVGFSLLYIGLNIICIRIRILLSHLLLIIHDRSKGPVLFFTALHNTVVKAVSSKSTKNRRFHFIPGASINKKI